MRKADVRSKLEVIPENIEKLEVLRALDYGQFCSDFRAPIASGFALTTPSLVQGQVL